MPNESSSLLEYSGPVAGRRVAVRPLKRAPVAAELWRGPAQRRRGAARAAVLLGAAVVVLALGGLIGSGALDRWMGGGTSLLEEDSKAPKDDAQTKTEAPATTAVAPSATAPSNAGAASPSERDPDAFTWNEQAVAALGDKEYDRAIELLINAMTERPDIDVFSSNLAEAYLQRAKFREDLEPLAAAEDYGRAMELTENVERREQIARLQKRALAIGEREADFTVESTLHFTFRFDGARQEILGGVDELKGLLESTYQEYGDLFSRRPVEEGEPRIEVVFYRSEGFNAVTGLGDWAGGVFDGTIRVPADDLRDRGRVQRLQEVLRHEVAHAFTQSIGGKRVPSWLNEGLAQWLESPGSRAAEVRIARARLKASGEELFPLSALQGTLSQWKDRAKISRAYDQALAFTAYLIEQYGADLAFRMVAACKSAGAEGAAQAFQSTILVDLDVVLSDFADSLRR